MPTVADQPAWTRIPGAPPNLADYQVPHVMTFQSVIMSASRTYRASDEAMKHSWDNARFMRNDPSVMECVEHRQRSSALLDWHLEPEEAKDPTQKWLAEQLTAIIAATPRFMQFRESLLEAIWFGKAATSLRLAWKRIKGQFRYAIAEWLPVNGDKLLFRFDNKPGMCRDRLGIRVGAGFYSAEEFTRYCSWSDDKKARVFPVEHGLGYFFTPVERDFFCVHKHRVEDGEYEDPANAGRIHGVGVRSRIYWAWYQKQECLAFLMEFLERSANGFEIWYYPQGNPEALEQTKKAAQERIGENRNIILVPKPLGEEGLAYGVERIEPSMAGAEALKAIITEYFGAQVKRYILGQTLTTEAASTGLGSNLASVHLDTYLQIVRYDCLNLEESLTTDLVEPIKRLNFPKYAAIPIRFRIQTESPDVEGKLRAWREAWEMGCRLKARDVMALIGAGEPEPNDEVLSQQKQQQQVGQGGGGDGDPGRNPPTALLSGSNQIDEDLATETTGGQSDDGDNGGGDAAPGQGDNPSDTGGGPGNPKGPQPLEQYRQPERYAQEDRQGNLHADNSGEFVRKEGEGGDGDEKDRPIESPTTESLLKKPPVKVIETQRRFHGDIRAARKWALANIRTGDKPIKNLDTGMKIGIGRDAIDKAASESAVRPSRTLDHIEVFAVLPDLLRSAMLAESHPDRKNDANIRAVHRLYAPLRIGRAVYRVKLTVREHVSENEGKTYRTHELAEIEMPAWNQADARPEGPTPASTAGTEISIRDLLDGVKKQDGSLILPEDDSKGHGQERYVRDANPEPRTPNFVLFSRRVLAQQLAERYYRVSPETEVERFWNQGADGEIVNADSAGQLIRYSRHGGMVSCQRIAGPPDCS